MVKSNKTKKSDFFEGVPEVIKQRINGCLEAEDLGRLAVVAKAFNWIGCPIMFRIREKMNTVVKGDIVPEPKKQKREFSPLEHQKLSKIARKLF